MGIKGDKGTDDGKAHSCVVDKGVSSCSHRTVDVSVAKVNNLQLHKNNKMNDGKEEVKVLSRRTLMRKNKRMRRIAAAVLEEGDGGLHDKDGLLEENVQIHTAMANDGNNAETQYKGFIFICNSKTKEDCFKYNIFGLPSSRKEMVAQIYSGMKLFLYDVDLKLLHGIYSAVGSGQYNIAPKAFNLAFPSQVRFTVLYDCAPLSEYNFRAVIFDNYTVGSTFDCLLSGDQVQQLCKRFRLETERTQPIRNTFVRIEGLDSTKRNREREIQIPHQSERRWTGSYLNDTSRSAQDHYFNGTYAHPTPPSYLHTSHLAAPVAQPLPPYAHRGTNFYGSEEPVAGSVHHPYSHYQSPVQNNQSYRAGSSRQYYDPLRLRHLH